MHNYDKLAYEIIDRINDYNIPIDIVKIAKLFNVFIEKLKECDLDKSISNESKYDDNGKLTISLNTFTPLESQRYYVSLEISKYICNKNHLNDYEKLARCILVPKYILDYLIMKKDITSPFDLAKNFQVEYGIINERLKELNWI